MTMNNATQELNLSELHEVSGGIDAVSVITGPIVVIEFMASHHGLSDAINYIKQQAGK